MIMLVSPCGWCRRGVRRCDKVTWPPGTGWFHPDCLHLARIVEAALSGTVAE